jgi:hypothetical protein
MEGPKRRRGYMENKQKRGYTVSTSDKRPANRRGLKKKKRGYRVCSSGYA